MLIESLLTAFASWSAERWPVSPAPSAAKTPVNNVSTTRFTRRIIAHDYARIGQNANGNLMRPWWYSSKTGGHPPINNYFCYICTTQLIAHLIVCDRAKS